MKNKLWLKGLALLGLAPCAAYAYDHQVSGVLVGFVRVTGNYGASAFGRADGAAFSRLRERSTVYYTTTSGYCQFQIVDLQ